MTDQKMVSDQPADDSVNVPGDDMQSESQSSRDSVQYSTYQRVLSEKKKAAAELARAQRELDEIRAQQESEKESALKENQQWKELYEQEQQKREQALQKAQALEEQQMNARKLNAVLKTLPANVPSDYWDLIPTTQVKVNPETGDIDEDSVKSVAEYVTTKLDRILDRPANGSKVDPTAPKANGSGTLTKDEWLKLDSKQRQQRAGDVQGVPEWMVTGA